MSRWLLCLSCLLCLSFATSSEAHWIRGGGDNPRCNCGMCTHNRAHRAGLPMDHGTSNVRPVAPTAVVPVAPVITQPSVTAVAVEDEYTPHDLVRKIVSVIHPVKSDVLYDLGCGDGRLLVYAAKHFGCRCVGYEIEPDRVKIARENVRKAGLENLVTIIQGDVTTDGLVEHATIVVAYQFEELLSKLRPRLDNARSLHCVCSIEHPLPWWWSAPRVKHTSPKGKFYVYRR